MASMLKKSAGPGSSSDRERASQLLDLPAELLLHISAFLVSDRDLSSLASTCKSLHQVLGSDIAWKLHLRARIQAMEPIYGSRDFERSVALHMRLYGPRCCCCRVFDRDSPWRRAAPDSAEEEPGADADPLRPPEHAVFQPVCDDVIKLRGTVCLVDTASRRLLPDDYDGPKDNVRVRTLLLASSPLRLHHLRLFDAEDLEPYSLKCLAQMDASRIMRIDMMFPYIAVGLIDGGLAVIDILRDAIVLDQPAPASLAHRPTIMVLWRNVDQAAQTGSLFVFYLPWNEARTTDVALMHLDFKPAAAAPLEMAWINNQVPCASANRMSYAACNDGILWIARYDGYLVGHDEATGTMEHVHRIHENRVARVLTFGDYILTSGLDGLLVLSRFRGGKFEVMKRVELGRPLSGLVRHQASVAVLASESDHTLQAKEVFVLSLPDLERLAHFRLPQPPDQLVEYGNSMALYYDGHNVFYTTQSTSFRVLRNRLMRASVAKAIMHPPGSASSS